MNSDGQMYASLGKPIPDEDRRRLEEAEEWEAAR